MIGWSGDLKVILFIVFLMYFDVGISDSYSDEVKDLPGLTTKINFRQYSGYLNASTEKFLHYWFVESQKDPVNDPVVVWLNGGPGCSSMDGMLNELGPFHVNKDGKTLYINPYSWNMVANVIFLEAPAGVGYSYSTNTKYYTTNDDIVSQDNYNALLHFFQKYPQFKKNDFYISGESYAGIYVPTLSVRVLADESINFKGFAIGNGYLNKKLNMNSLAFFLYHHGLVDDTLWDELVTNCCDGGKPVPESCDFVVGTTACAAAVKKSQEMVKNLNMYNIYADCVHSSSKSSRMNRDYENLMRAFPFSSKLSEIPPCTDEMNMTTWLNLKSVREALHIPTFLPQWEICNSKVSDNYKRLYDTMKPQVLKLLNSGKLRGLIYNGDVDIACNFLGDEWFVHDLQLQNVTTYRQWIFDGQIAGFTKSFRNLTFTTIRGSGHMVPQDKPGPAFKMISSFLFRKPF